MLSPLESSQLRNTARTHKARPEQPTGNTSHETENGIESNPRPVGLSASYGQARAALLAMSLPPAGRRKGVRKSKRPQDIRGDKEENGAGGSSAYSSGSIGPFFIGNRCATVRDGKVHISRNHRLVPPLICSLRRRSFPRDDCRKESSSSGTIVHHTVVGVFFRASLESVVVVFFEGDALVVESAHLRTSVCNYALTCEVAFLVGETRVAAIECHGPELRHVADVYIMQR